LTRHGRGKNAVIRDISTISERQLTADVCIVGSGAAGLVIATELDRSELRVVVLEGGGRRFAARAQRLFDSEVVGLAHGGIHAYRFRMFGGATTRWAGQALPLDAIDFEERDWVPSSGWPITRDDLEPYYTRAVSFMGIDAFPRDPSTRWPSALSPPPRFNRDRLTPSYSQFTAQPNFAETHGAELSASANVDVLLGANVSQLITDLHATEVQAVQVRSLDGHELAVRAGLFVICAGGIETARILLASDQHSEGGVGNNHDLVGRYFQDHPGLTVGKIVPVNGRAFSNTFRPRKEGGIKFQPRFSLADHIQRQERLLNTSGSVLFHTTQSPSITAGTVLYRSLRQPDLRPGLRAAAKTVLGDPLPLVRAAGRHFILRQPALDPTAIPELAIGGEQAPNRDSRIFLTDQRDALGMRRAALDWRLTEAEIRAWRRTAEIVAQEFERLDVGRVDLEGFELDNDPAKLSGRIVDAGHHMGTTRMSKAADTGVVDPECRVHGIDNLYIGSSSVFPTSGSSNPTLTIIALALRISDTIRRRAARHVEIQCR
jgi:choline dehydrogenase-like flavoprotein